MSRSLDAPRLCIDLVHVKTGRSEWTWRISISFPGLHSSSLISAWNVHIFWFWYMLILYTWNCLYLRVIFESKATKTFFVSSASRTLIDCIAGASLTPEALAVRIEPLQATRVHYECDCMCMYNIFFGVYLHIYIYTYVVWLVWLCI